MTLQPRRAHPSLGAVAISVAAGVIVLLGGLFVNGCRISKLLSRSSADSTAGGGLIVVVPSVVRDSALAGTNAPRVTDLAVTNGGTWSASADDDWMQVTPSSGGARARVRLSLDPKNLEPGWHQGLVTVQERESADVSTTVEVNFLIQQPILQVKPGNLSYEARNDHSVFNDTLQVTNDGDGPLVWTAATEDHASWLTLSDTAGTGPGPIAVRVNNEGLSYFGTYKETIIVESPGAKNSPKRIEVTLRRRRHD